MKTTVLRLGDETFRFEQDDKENWIIGEVTTRGVTHCTYSKMVDAEFGNNFYKQLISQGFKKVDPPVLREWD